VGYGKKNDRNDDYPDTRFVVSFLFKILDYIATAIGFRDSEFGPFYIIIEFRFIEQTGFYFGLPDNGIPGVFIRIIVSRMVMKNSMARYFIERKKSHFNHSGDCKFNQFCQKVVVCTKYGVNL